MIKGKIKANESDTITVAEKAEKPSDTGSVKTAEVSIEKPAVVMPADVDSRRKNAKEEAVAMSTEVVKEESHEVPAEKPPDVGKVEKTTASGVAAATPVQENTKHDDIKKMSVDKEECSAKGVGDKEVRTGTVEFV
jgi:hypothetical protein